MLTNSDKISLKLEKQEVELNGWVSKRRSLGGLIFIDLRDKYGIVQLVCRPESPLYELANSLRNEYCINVKGIVEKRESTNSNLKTGDLEVVLTSLTVLNKSINPPLIIQDKTDALEDLRLKYRYLDLRRPIQKNFLIQRANIVKSVRKSLEEMDFMEIETPILSKSTPEGARDYLVPSRLYNGQFYALPQSPQIYKQLLMIAGFERYYQIAKCFRDEDLRADRQPEFDQIDLEVSFLNEDQIKQIVEKMFKNLFKDIKNIELKTPFKTITYNEAISKYGSDKPDLRYELFINDYNFLKSETNFLNKFESVRGIKLDKASEISRKNIDQFKELLNKNSCSNIAYIKMQDNKLQGSILKELTDEQIKKLDLKENEIIIFGLDTFEKASKGLGALRIHLANMFELIKPETFEILWVQDFPLFEYNQEEDKLESMHHAFTSPKDINMLYTNPKECLARHYDLVLNGYELGSGSIRIHEPELQQKVFELIGLSQEEALNKFGFLIEAFKYGAPPHGGIGLGLDRIVMILTNTANIKDVVAFPKTQSARDLMNESPSKVEESQLEELGLKIK